LRPILQEGDEIVISILEHHANFIPWQQLAIEKKARLVILPLDYAGEIEMTEYKKVLNDKTRMVAITHISNVTGGINPVKEMISAAHQFGAKVLIDGAQSVGHMPVNVHDLDCDFFAFSGHKIYGPTGTGVIYGKEEILNKMPPYRFGGEMILEVRKEYTNFKNTPYRFEAGTPNIAGVIGLGAAIRYIQSVSLDNITVHETNLTNYLQECLLTEGIHIIGNPKHRSSLISFLIDHIHPHDVATILDSEGIAVRAGHHCAQPLMRYLQIPATVRASLGWYNDQEDIDQLIQGIKKVRKIMQ
jgi:cysteine desulfurase/selenocysteine lyase